METAPVIGAKAVAFLCSVTVLIFDYFLTLQREVSLVWSGGWTVGTVLFVLNRYLPFADGFILYHATHSVLDPEECRKWDKVLAAVTFIGIGISEIILNLRTLALWSGNRLVSGLLITNFLCATVVCGALILVWSKSASSASGSTTVTERLGIPGCNVSQINNIFAYSFVVLLVLETVPVVLTALRARYHRSNSTSGWVMRLYQQGFLFYLYMLALTLLNIIWPLAGTPSQAHDNKLFTVPTRILHSIFCNRVFFIIFESRQDQSAFGNTRSRFNDDDDSSSYDLSKGHHRHRRRRRRRGGEETRSVGLVESIMMGPFQWLEEVDNEESGQDESRLRERERGRGVVGHEARVEG